MGTSGMRFYPGAVINNQTYLGNLNSDDIMEEICNSQQILSIKHFI